MSNGRAFAALAALGLALAGSSAGAAPVYPGCAVPPTVFAHAFSAGPETLPSILARAGDGDLIVLAAGDYGAVHLTRTNAGFVTLAAAKGQKPVFASLSIRGSHWVVRGVAVVGLSPPRLYGKWRAHLPLVDMQGGDNFVLEDDTVASRLGDYPWVEETIGDPDQPAVSDGVRANQSSCVAVVASHIFNVFNGIEVDGDQTGDHGRFYLLASNTIDNFAGDGIDHSVSDALIRGNLITDAHDICHSQCIHMDGIQGWPYESHPGIVNHDITIDGNRIIVQASPSLPLPADTLQGITIFNGAWKNLRITNNIVVTDVWHGISINGVDGLLIANNDVLPTTDRTTWILVGGSTREGVSDHVIVRNNIVRLVKLATTKMPVAHMTIDHNLQTDDPNGVFVSFDPKHSRYDFHLRPHSPATGRGSPDQAPPRDIDGVPRAAPISLGAYQ